MVKRIFQQKPASAAMSSGQADSRPAPDAFNADGAPGEVPGEVAVDDLNDLFAAVITRLSEWLVQPPAEPGVMLACVQALRQLHQTAANELLRRQHQLDGQP